MPHIDNAILNTHFWIHVCHLTGIRYIDPRLSIENVLSLIDQTDILLAEAMHGAIAAEALRVPWIPICTNSTILPFKWFDWCASINLEYKPIEIMPTVTDKNFLDYQKSTQDWLKILYREDYSPQAKFKFQKTHKNIVAEQLLAIAKTSSPNLAPENLIESLTIQLEEKLEQFKKDVKLGKFSTSHI